MLSLTKGGGRYVFNRHKSGSRSAHVVHFTSAFYIIAIAICGADSWVHVELFGKSELEWFQTFLELPHGIPSHDTFGAVF